jgi:hypothetical protein
MTISLRPPPLQIPAEFATDKLKNAFFSSLVTTIYQLWTNVYSIKTTAKITTTDAATTGLVRVPVPDGKTVMIQAMIVARRTGGSAGAAGDSAFYVLTGAYKNVAGVLTGIATPNLYGGEDQGSWNVGFSTLGSDAVVTVEGAVNNDVTWEGAISSYIVGA